jgi:predicted Zn finger-like uncharacterized protein
MGVFGGAVQGICMITTCPHCQTAFQITAEQLSAKAGLVRCGACMQVFNGYRGLTLTPPAVARDTAGGDAAAARPDSLPPAQADTAGVQVAAAEQSLFVQDAHETQTTLPSRNLLLPLEPLDASVPAAIAEAEALLNDETPPQQQSLDLDLSGDTATSGAWPPSMQTIRAEPAMEQAQPLRGPERQAAQHATAASATPGVQVGERERPAQAVIKDAAPRVAEPLYRPELHVPPTSPAWLLASAAMLALLALQAVYFWRGAIAQYWPSTRPYLETACASVGCTVPLAQELALLNIEASTLEADPARPGVVVLQTTLQNVAPFVQRYPHLELTLTGVNDDVLGVKTFAPNEYLHGEQDTRSGWAPKQTRAVALHLDVSALPPTGFRLRLLYP